MPIWRRMTAGTVLRAMLAGFLLPILLVLTPSTVQAAKVSGFSMTDGNTTFRGVTCKGSALWAVSGLGGTPVSVKGTCEQHGGVFPYSGWDDGSWVRFELEGRYEDGSVCKTQTGTLTLPGDVDPSPFEGTTAEVGAGCSLDRICFTAKNVQNNGFDRTYEACGSVSLDAPGNEAPEPSGECQYVTVGPGRGTFIRTDNGDGYYWIEAVKHAEPSTGSWYQYVVVRDAAGALQVSFRKKGLSEPWSPYVAVGHVRERADYHFGDPPLAPVDGEDVYEFVGMGYSLGPTNLTSADRVIPQTAAEAVDGLAGITDLDQCRHYYGEKIANVPDSDIDEPLGAVTPEPPPEHIPPEDVPDDSTGCNFDILDPSTYMCGLLDLIRELIRVVKDLLTGIWNAVKAVVGVLGDILAAIAGLIGDLIGALGDLLEFLFVPSQEHLQEKIDAVRSAWENAAPVVWVSSGIDVVQAMIVPAPTGCQGPDLTVTDPVSNGSHTLHPLAACDGAVAVIANVVNNALKVLLLGGAVMVGTRIVGRAMGIETTGTATSKGAE